MKMPTYEYYRSADRLWRFRLRAANGEIVTSGEGYVQRADCLHAIAILQASSGAPVVEVNAGPKAASSIALLADLVERSRVGASPANSLANALPASSVARGLIGSSQNALKPKP